jgi:hypothetical protein
MIAGKAKKAALARKRLRPLTAEELTQVSGGGFPFPFGHHRRHHRHHHHHHHHHGLPFPI